LSKIIFREAGIGELDLVLTFVSDPVDSVAKRKRQEREQGGSSNAANSVLQRGVLALGIADVPA